MTPTSGDFDDFGTRNSRYFASNKPSIKYKNPISFYDIAVRVESLEVRDFNRMNETKTVGAGAQRIADYLDGLKDDLVDEAAKQGWKVLEAEGLESPYGEAPHAYLLVPCQPWYNASVIRGYRIHDGELGEETAVPYDETPWIVERGGNKWYDVPAPHAEGVMDRRFVWVSRNPADALLLNRLGVTALSLADPCLTLGSKEGIEFLQEIGALTLTRERRGTLVIVDSQDPLDPMGCSLLCELFERVWQVQTSATPTTDVLAESRENPLSVTGRGLGDLIKTRSFPISDPVVGLEAFLMEQVSKVGRRLEPGHESLSRAKGANRGTETSDSDSPSSESRSLALTHRTADSIRTRNNTGDEWIVEPFLAQGRFTDIQGESSSGKTTFLLAMVSAVTQGGIFIDKQCRKTKVVYITEQYEISFKDNIENEKGLLDGIRFITADDYVGIEFHELVDLVRACCRDMKAELVIFDTIYPIANMVGGPSTSAGQIDKLFRVLRPLAQDGIAVVLVRHGSGKAPLSKSGAGSRAFAASADYRFGLSAPTEETNLRHVTMESRRMGNRSFVINLLPSGIYELAAKSGEIDKANVYEQSGSRVDEAATGTNRPTRWSHSTLDESVKRILKGVEPPGLTSGEIVQSLENADGVGPRRSTVDKSLRRLEGMKHVVVFKPNEPKKPNRYSLVGE